ncbi:MAG TPA: hypothetical protein VLE99_03580 [Candidatus Saccharimonadales bacterium]|nr:hypothetical protein [Candidatus Saccharimonadales bacterium]
MNEEQAQKPISNKEYERAFSEFAAFLFTQYKKKKQADLTNEPNKDIGQIEDNVS